MITQRLGAEEGDTPVDQQPAAMQDFDPTYDRCGSGADITRLFSYVRFAPKSGQTAEVPGCPLCAKSGLTHPSKE
jgi:hypothetical protein